MSQGDKIYEMLWDCSYCGTQKLLGKTHRFCPGCGAPQDAAGRYFPSDADKVEVHDHVFVGVDLHCPACGSAMSARVVHCTQCGSPMDGSAPVPLVSEPAADGGPVVPDAEAPAPDPQALAQEIPRPRSRWGRFLAWGAGLSFLLCGGFCSVMMITEPVQATVQGRAWSRAIQIESYLAREGSAWCDSMPARAYRVSRSRKERSTRQVANGQDCRTVRTDQGDGTYRESRECTTRYREESIMGDHCSFVVNAWGAARTASAVGGSQEPPRWPDPQLARAGECLGCEREGRRTATYKMTVAFEGDTTTCEVAEPLWSRTLEGARIRAERTKLGGLVLCSGLGEGS